MIEHHLLNGKVKIMQLEDGFRVSQDAVYLAASVPDVKGSILDVGVGTGGAALCVAHRLPHIQITGLDVQKALADLAVRNFALNGFENRCSVVVGDVQHSVFPAGSFDCVMTNPPFYRGMASPKATKAKAHTEDVSLSTWLERCVYFLKPRGTLVLICEAPRLDEILGTLYGKVGALEVFPLYSKMGQNAHRVIVRGRKGMKTPLTLFPGLIVHDKSDAYTAQADAILRDGKKLF